MAEEIQNIFAAQKVDLQTEINKPVGGMVIYNSGMANVKLDHYLSEFLGIGSNLMFITYVKRLTSPSTFIHCDLVDKEQNLLNGKPLTLLARFDLRGNPFEKIHYQTAQQHVLRDTSTGNYYVNSVTISIRDENGNLFDFKYINIPLTIMSSANVLPSVPEYAEQLYPINEITQINAEDFCLKKISDLQTELNNEAGH